MTHGPGTANVPGADGPGTPGPGAVGSAGTGALTAVFVRIKLSLLRNGLRQSSGRTAVFVVSAVLSLLFAAGQLLGLVLLRGHAQAATVAVLLTGLTALGWAVVPLFFPSGDETLDPTRLVMLPLRAGPLVWALLVASLVGIGPLFTLCLVLGAGVSVAHGAFAVAVAVVAVPLALLVCLALARAVAAANIRLLTSRKGRDLALLSGLVVAIGIQVVNFGAQRLGRAGGLARLEPAADLARWVPPASAVGAVDAAGRGAYGTAAAQLLLSAAALVALLLWWRRSLTRLMTAPDGSTVAAATATGADAVRGGSRTGWTRLLPEGRTGAVVQRALRYAWRDPKAKSGWVTSLALGLIVPVFNALQGTGSVYWACFAAGLLGTLMYNQFGQDTSAFWIVATTVSSKRDAYAELRARVLALLLVTLPYVTVVTVVTVAVLGDWEVLAEGLGLSYGLLGAMLGVGAWASASFPYSIPQDSAYKGAAPGQGGLAWASMLGGMLLSAVLCTPLIAAAVWTRAASTGPWVLLPLGAVWGALLTWGGLHLAAGRMFRRLPEILAAVSKA
ncbi:transporter [Streptomyces sp. MRC013]|uniref:transporter n=1 Tax=Streptomyces sp. MRC013 TaxID=2898276 RepID=UPI00202709A2|nr:transporter [Streptomyces sp. MRC013]URM90967.1 transporter [Streptomyces sp. MRC013]